MAIRIKRAYDPPAPEDGVRILVDRLWPRGLTKEKLQLAAWMKEISPSIALRQSFHHDVPNWDAFRTAYFAELDANPSAVQTLLDDARAGNLTLVYAARDTEHNNAAVWKEYLESKR
ncbi:MAG TPA: DUF488 domain-containing protein [Bellilinea sp.]|nr:DUF488 domain-containing protein [Bellilinea sp.]